MENSSHLAPKWTYYANALLGLWLLAGPTAMDYGSGLMAWNDLVCGVLVIIFSLAALRPSADFIARWSVCLVGLWLLFAPLFFWAPTAASYNNDTIVGALLIAFSILVPMMPGKAHHEIMQQPGADVPPGWTYNPSTWTQRAPIIAMAFVGFFLSRHLAAYQLGHISDVWEPFFGNSTKRVLESDVSKWWLISDAGLGAASYMVEALSGFMGGVSRWRTMPWMVAMFGFLVIPVGTVSIILVILQPVAVGAWCTVCLFTAGAMLIMIPFTVDEVVAMAQYMAGVKKRGEPFWRTFWVGGVVPKEEAGESKSDKATGGLAVPWNPLACALVGIWVMAAPGVLGIPMQTAAADRDFLAGAMIATFAVIAFADVSRTARFLCIPFAIWLLVGPLLQGGANTLSDVISGITVIMLSIPRGKVKESYGTWNKFIV